MKVYAIWNTEKHGFMSGGYGCVGGISITTFNTKKEALSFAKEHCRHEYKIKGISVA